MLPGAGLILACPVPTNCSWVRAETDNDLGALNPVKSACLNHLSSGSMAVSVEAQPLIAVRDVRASSRWYGTLFAADSLPDHPHRDFYDRVSSCGRFDPSASCLGCGASSKPRQCERSPSGPRGIFQVDNFDSVVGERGNWEQRWSWNLTSIRHPNTEKYGFAILTVMYW